MAAVGDIMMGSDFPTAKLPPRGGRDLFAAVAPYLRRADIALGNLEGPLCSEQTPTKEPLAGRRYLFRTPPSYAQNLKDAGLSVLSLANNHAVDFGRAGLEATRQALSGAGLQFSSKKGEIARFDLHGVRVAVIALSYGPPPRSIVFPAQPLQEIERVARDYDLVILSIHAGAEGRGALHVAPGQERFLDEPRGDLVRFAHEAVERGADLVLAHGPHVPRALELYRGRLIAYSLGNFATYGGVSVAGESGYAPLLTVELAADGSFVGGSIDSFRQFRYTGPKPDPKRRALRLMRMLSAADFPESPLVFGEGGRITVKK
ncbi:CapA family protein [Geomonas nitrogeniifigens]|uniref:CapA family protein n=2 Tax=Geomonas diazotrophica TaxID=2843197 RepID=A0ABX8JF21_9BACT|nr:CapA family protein [Geomonas nitrogeniifigens]QWV96077.1 CapA family protein [Geomonas nitrogeniifigens]QXE85145.1 CapA family protein [Geomonas nitrogeniifigens]